MSFSTSGFGQITPAVKNLIIINVLAWLATAVLKSQMGINLNDSLGLHCFMSGKFSPIQLLTYMFLHGGFSHLFFNMFAVFMFGRIIEQTWGTSRFVVYYFVTGIGAGLINMLAQYYDILPMIQSIDLCMSEPTTANLDALIGKYGAVSFESQRLVSGFISSYNGLINSDPAAATSIAREFLVQYQEAYIDAHVTIGASGSVFGVLLAFGMLFPNMYLMLLIPPIPIKAKYFVIGYAVIELFMGVQNFAADNIAHWAHLGGMFFGFLLIKFWQKH